MTTSMQALALNCCSIDKSPDSLVSCDTLVSCGCSSWTVSFSSFFSFCARSVRFEDSLEYFLSLNAISDPGKDFNFNSRTDMTVDCRSRAADIVADRQSCHGLLTRLRTNDEYSMWVWWCVDVHFDERESLRVTTSQPNTVATRRERD